MKVTATARPFLMTIHGDTFPVTSYEVQTLIDMTSTFGVKTATRNRVVLVNPKSPSGVMVFTPATLGGGPAFVIARPKAVR